MGGFPFSLVFYQCTPSFYASEYIFFFFFFVNYFLLIYLLILLQPSLLPFFLLLLLFGLFSLLIFLFLLPSLQENLSQGLSNVFSFIIIIIIISFFSPFSPLPPSEYLSPRKSHLISLPSPSCLSLPLLLPPPQRTSLYFLLHSSPHLNWFVLSFSRFPSLFFSLIIPPFFFFLFIFSLAFSIAAVGLVWLLQQKGKKVYH